MEGSMVTSATLNIPAGLESRVLKEGYGPGAWHGADLKAALGDVNAALAYRRPAAGRHNIAEIALHHAYCVRAVRGQITGVAPEPFVREGDDWFELADEKAMTWSDVKAAVASEQDRLAAAVAAIEAGATSPLADAERFNLELGITCHAIYHAGQVQLLKRLRVE
jgi:DinB family protein